MLICEICGTLEHKAKTPPKIWRFQRKPLYLQEKGDTIMKTIDQILKIKAVVLYILKAFPEGVDYIHLFKVMYFAQQDQLKEYGLPIMYDTFVARKHGPVPALTYKVLRGIEGKADLSSPELKDFADSLNIAISQDGHQLVLASKNAECDMDELSVADVKMLDKWIEKCKDVESFDLSDKSHEDRAWKRAKRQADKTGEDSKITMYDMAAAAGASKDMLCIIRDRQSVQKALSWI